MKKLFYITMTAAILFGLNLAGIAMTAGTCAQPSDIICLIIGNIIISAFSWSLYVSDGLFS